MMLFAWLKNRRRRKLLATPFPAEWLPVLERLGHYRLLDARDQAKLRDDVRIFLAEKEFEGCKGFVVTDEVRVTIAALASILTLGLPDCHFDNVHTILVYPKGFLVKEQLPLGGDVVLEHESARLGEAHY